MAGKEQRGVEAAEAGLFRKRTYVLTPHAGGDSGVPETFRYWLNRIGATIIEMSAQEHDATVALTSHLPQLVSTALAATLARAERPFVRDVFGSGLLDMTRLALSSPDLWLSIFETNKTEVTLALEAFVRQVIGIQEALQVGELEKYFTLGRDFAYRIRETSS